MPTQSFKVGEMLNKRTKNTKTWMNFDGSYTTEIHSGVVHFDDGLNNLHNINTSLFDEADADTYEGPTSRHGKNMMRHEKEKVKDKKKQGKMNRDDFDYQVPTLPFSCQIPKNIKKGYSIGKNDEFVRFIPHGVSPSKGFVNRGKSNEIQYQDAWNDTDIILEVTDRGIKETMILKTDRAPFKFSFEVDGHIEDDLTMGNMKLEPAWLIDAIGEKRDVSQTIRREGEQTFIDLVADVTGLVYPIEIDPTVTLVITSVLSDGYVGSANMGYSMTSADMNMWNAISGGQLQNRDGLVKFDLSSIPSGSQVTSASMTLNQSYYYNTKGAGYRIVTNIASVNITDSATSGTHYGKRTGSNNVTTITSTGNGDKTIDVTNATAGQVSGAYPAYGYYLSAGSDGNMMEGDYVDVRFRTKEQGSTGPRLFVVYNLPPTAPTVIAPNGGETWNSSHTITWSGSTDPDATVDYFGPFGQSSLRHSVHANNHPTQTFKATSAALVKVIEMYGHNNLGYQVTLTAKLYMLAANGTLGTLLGTATYLVANGGLNALSFDFQSQGITLINGQMYGVKISSTDATGIELHYGQTYDDGVAYNGTWYALAQDFSFRVGTISNKIQYQIQLTTDGTNWGNIVALTAVGATQYIYDFINQPQTSVAKIRIRAYDGAIYGPWDYSDGVFSIIHNVAPTAPTNLTPVTTKDRAELIRFTWQHNDPNADAQSKFDLDYRLQGSTTWNTVTQNTINQFYDLPAGTLPRGTIEWRVRTYDQADLSGPYSELKTFFAGDKPSKPTTLNPIDGSVVSVSNPTVQWSSVGQVSYNLKVLNANETTTLWETNQTSNNKAHTVGYSLENETGYVIQLTIKNVDGIISDIEKSHIHVSYTPPAKALVTTSKGAGFITVLMDNPVPVGTEPNVSYNSIFRRKQGENEFIRIGTNISVDGSFNDYTAASEQVYEYFVRTWGENDTYNDSVIVYESITLRGVWLHDVTNPDSVHNFIFDGDGRSEDWQAQASYMQFAGRKSPVTEFGEHEHKSISVTLNMLKRTADLPVLENLLHAKNTLCYRDGRGRRIFGTATSLPTGDEFYGYVVDLNVIECSYSEEV